MLTAIQWLLCGVGGLLMVPVSVLLVEVVAALVPRSTSDWPDSSRGSRRVAVIIPAHNECLHIAATVQSVRKQLALSDSLLVVADNCTDDTAAIAAANGAEVLIRQDLLRRGKGYALDFGIRHMESRAPDIVIFVDADCLVGEESIPSLVSACISSNRPVQALYLMHGAPDSPSRTRVAEFAWLLKNKVRPLGLHRLGLPCQLMGTGMAFPWETIRTAQLASGHIVEDMKLGLDLAEKGTSPIFCVEASVTSEFASSVAGEKTQRTRWEHGHLGMILTEAPTMILRAILRGDIKLLALTLDLCVPPLALLVFSVSAFWIGSAGYFLYTRSQLPLDMLTAVALMLATSIILYWATYGRHLLGLLELLSVAKYLFHKLPLYLKFLFARQSNWVRSQRGKS